MTETTTAEKPQIKSGMIVRVHQKIKDVGKKGEVKERVQVFEGTVIAAKHGKQPGATITVRKVSNGVGVEKIFPIYSPLVDRIEVVKTLKVRRSKLGFIRDPKFKKRLKEKKVATKK